MNGELTPKKDFIRDTKAREAWAILASNPLLHQVFALALAEMHARGLGPHDMAGVNGFIFTVLNFSEEHPVPRSMTSKHLQSFGQPTNPPEAKEA